MDHSLGCPQLRSGSKERNHSREQKTEHTRMTTCPKSTRKTEETNCIRCSTGSTGSSKRQERTQWGACRRRDGTHLSFCLMLMKDMQRIWAEELLLDNTGLQTLAEALFLDWDRILSSPRVSTGPGRVLLSAHHYQWFPYHSGNSWHGSSFPPIPPLCLPVVCHDHKCISNVEIL